MDIAAHVIINPLPNDTPTMKSNEIRPFEDKTCVPQIINFENIKVDLNGRLIEINTTPVLESIVWRTNTPGPGVAGAYLMSVTNRQDILNPKSHKTCEHIDYTQIETVFDMVTRFVKQ